MQKPTCPVVHTDNNTHRSVGRSSTTPTTAARETATTTARERSTTTDRAFARADGIERRGARDRDRARGRGSFDRSLELSTGRGG